MKTKAACLAILIVISALLIACSEPTKPIKKLNIKRASDLEPIAAPRTGPATPAEAPASQEAESVADEQMEIVEVQGFRGACDSTFVGINDEIADLPPEASSRTTRSPRSMRLPISISARRARCSTRSSSAPASRFHPRPLTVAPMR